MFTRCYAVGKLLIFIFLFLLLSQKVRAQVFPIKFYTGDKNCSLLNAQIVNQDSRGILWIGTAYRLTWYDGSHFINQKLPLVAGQLYVTNIVNDKNGQVWITTFYNGLYRYDGKSYRNYLPDTVNVNANCNNVFDIVPITESLYAVATDGSVFLFDGNKFSELDNSNPDLKTFINSLAVDNSGRLFIATANGLITYQFSNSKVSQPKTFLANLPISKVSIATDQSVWLLTVNGLQHFANTEALQHQNASSCYFKKEAVTNFSLSGNTVTVTIANTVYQITNAELEKMDLSNQLQNDLIRNVFTDNENNKWLVLSNGIAKLANQHAVYYNLEKETIGKNIHDVLLVNDSVLLTTSNNGLGLLNTHRVSVTELTLPRKLKIDYFFQLLEYGKIFLAATNIGILAIDTVQKKVSLFNAYHSEAMFKVNDSVIWFSGYKNSVGLLEGNLFKELTIDQEIMDRVSAICLDDKGRVWLGCWNKGLYVCERNGNKLVVVQHLGTDNGFKNLRIRSLLFDSNGLLYAGTRTQGIFVFDTKKSVNKTLINYTETQGLSGPWVKQLKKFNSKIYAATNEGVFVLMAPEHRFEKVSDNDFNFETNSFSIDERILYRGTQNGIVKSVFSTTVSDTVWPAFISKVSINGKSDTAFIPYRQQFIRSAPLAYDQNNIAFDFTALCYNDESTIRYQYRLWPQQKEWSAPTTANFITYSQLIPNTYSFEVRASTNELNWSEIAVYKFEVLAPFYRTTWFYLLIIALIALLIYSYYRMKIKQIEALQNVRNRIARDLHDDVGSALSTINIFSAMAKQNFDNSPQKAELLVDKISETSQHMLYNMRDIVWSISPKNDTMLSIVARMREYASSVCEAKNIDAIFNFSESATQLHLNMHKRYDLLMIFKEAVNNCVKYADCSQIIIKLDCNASVLVMEIADNGTGFEMSKVNQGNGLANMKQRATAIGANLIITSHTGNGCTISLTLPI